MKLFAFILLVTLVVGDGFYQPFSPVLKSPWPASFPARLPFLPNYRYNVIYTINPIPTMSYYDYKKNPHQGVFLGQQRSVKKDYGDQLVEDWQANPMEPKISFSRQRFPSWNHKFFLLDNEAHTVHALRPFNPLEMFSLNQIKPSSPLTRPMFARQTVRMTNTETIRVTSTKICVSSQFFNNTINPTICPTYNRTRRSFDSDDEFLENVSPTVINQEELVMPTVLVTDSWRSPVYEIESTKDEDFDSRLEFVGYEDLMRMTRRDRAMFNRIPSTSTVTVITSETYFVTKAVNPVTTTLGQPGPLLCIPPGIVVCA